MIIANQSSHWVQHCNDQQWQHKRFNKEMVLFTQGDIEKKSSYIDECGVIKWFIIILKSCYIGNNWYYLIAIYTFQPFYRYCKIYIHKTAKNLLQPHRLVWNISDRDTHTPWLFMLIRLYLSSRRCWVLDNW